jgi:hypothetical protein
MEDSKEPRQRWERDAFDWGFTPCKSDEPLERIAWALEYIAFQLGGLNAAAARMAPAPKDPWALPD